MEKRYEIFVDEKLNEVVINDLFTGATLQRTIVCDSENITILDMFRDYFDNN